MDFRSMITSRQIQRLTHNEQIPVIVLSLAVVLVIHLCNKHDERTANQYMLPDTRPVDSLTCALYPTSMQGKQHV
jgi:hypothetical protein